MTIELPSRPSNLLLLLLALAPIGCDDSDGDTDDVADTTGDGDGDGDGDTSPDPANGEAIHDQGCALTLCHAPGEEEQLALSVPMLSDQEIRDQVREGSTSPDTGMPPFNTNAISDSELEDLLAFLRQMYP